MHTHTRLKGMQLPYGRSVLTAKGIQIEPLT